MKVDRKAPCWVERWVDWKGVPWVGKKDDQRAAWTVHCSVDSMACQWAALKDFQMVAEMVRKWAEKRAVN